MAAAAYAKESLNDLRKVPAKPYLVNLTFWEDRPRLNLWEEMVRQRQRKELEEQENEARRQQEKMKVTHSGGSRTFHPWTWDLSFTRTKVY